LHCLGHWHPRWRGIARRHGLGADLSRHQAPAGQKPGRTRHRVSIAIGAVIDSISEQFVFPRTNVVTALGEADGESLVTAASMLLTIATGATDGASAVVGAGIRVALPTGNGRGETARQLARPYGGRLQAGPWPAWAMLPDWPIA